MKNEWKPIERTFSSICWITAISFTICCLYKFGLDKDLCTVTYQTFYQNEGDVFPVLSLCFKSPYIGHDSQTTNYNGNETSLIRYLEGKDELPNNSNLRYENFTMDINHYVLGYWIRWRNGSTNYALIKDKDHSYFSTSHLGFLFKDSIVQCFAIDVPENNEVQIFTLLIDSLVFRPGKVSGLFSYTTFLHYPNQLLRSQHTLKGDWPKRPNNSSYTIRLRIDSIDVLKRRNKLRHPCNENWKNYDDHVRAKHTSLAGCSRPYQQTNAGVRKCMTRNELSKSVFRLRADDYGLSPPCKSMERIAYRIEDETFEEDSEWYRPGTFWIGPYFPPTFKEIEETRFVKKNLMTNVKPKKLCTLSIILNVGCTITVSISLSEPLAFKP